MIFKRIDIWQGKNYKGKRGENGAPYMDAYVIDGEKKRPAILILPGGGYAFTSAREGEPIALKFIQAGFHAFVLHYSVAPNRHPQPLLDASLAMSIIRENSAEWNINENKVIVCGFSAGGHLTATLGVYWNKEYITRTLNIKRGANKPNGLILGYPLITTGDMTHEDSIINLLGEGAEAEMIDEMSAEKHVGSHTPPSFIWHTFSDGAVSYENSLCFASALGKNKIPFELHIYPEGVHGLSLGTEETAYAPKQINSYVSGWIDLCISWISLLEEK